MGPSPSRVAEAFPAIGLERLDEHAALRERADVKYVIPIAAFAALAGRLLPTHTALEISGRRAFAYRSTYFDTPALGAFRDHIQQRRRRYKCRAREYLHSGDFAFEVKLKGARGETIKHRIPHDGHDLSDAAVAFLRECLDRAYGFAPDAALRPVLTVAYTRVTLVAPGERVTCDYDLTFAGPSGGTGWLDPGMAIVESKSAHGNARADRVLRELRHRPQPGCSKYCLGIALTRSVADNPLRSLLRRHFRAA
jgi:VTC domain-containing protein